MSKQHITDYERGLYDATYREIFIKNFLVGVSRGLGTIIIQFVFLAVLYGLFVQFVLPRVSPYFSTLDNAVQQLENFGRGPANFFGGQDSTR